MRSDRAGETVFMRAKRIYEATLMKAKSGDPKALRRLMRAADRFLTAALDEVAVSPLKAPRK